MKPPALQSTPERSPLAEELRVLLRREYLAGILLLARVALKRHYRATFLGMTWSLLQPAIQIFIFWAVFSKIMRFPLEHYALYLISGLLPWTFISNSLLGGADSLLSRGGTLKHCLISKTMFPLADTLTHFYMFCLALVAMYTFSLVVIAPFEWRVLLLPIAVVPIAIFTFSCSVAIAFATPYARDLGHLLSVVFAAFFWLTPIIYPVEALPGSLRSLVMFNPFYIMIRPVQVALYGADFSFPKAVGYALVVAAVTTIVAYATYRRLRWRVIFYL